MRYISIVLALSTLLFVAAASGQQTTPGNTKSGVGIDTVINCTVAANNYIPVFTSVLPPNIVICNSVMYQAGSNIGVGTKTPAAPLDVVGSVNTNMNYEIGENTVLNIGSPGDDNLFVGVGAGFYNNAGTGTTNTFVGHQAGYNNRPGNSNTFYGALAGYNNNNGNLNTFVGEGAGFFNVNGNSNTFVGENAGAQATGSGNTFVGDRAGFASSTASGNTFVGAGAGINNAGPNNAFFGNGAGQANTTGDRNTYVGAGAGQNNTAYFNTFVGYQAGVNNTGGNANVYIANQGLGSPSESNTIRIGNPDFQLAAYVAGIYGVNVSGIPVQINSNGQLGAQVSSLRFKEQVRDMGDSTNALMKLRPVTFFYKPEYANGEHTLQYGLIAEEVAKVYPELVAYDTDGKPYSVRYQYLTTMLLNEVQKQYRQAETQAALIKAQQQQIEGLQQQLQVQNATLQERLSRLESAVRVEVASVK